MYISQSSMASCSCMFSLLPLKIWCRSQQCSRGSCSTLLWTMPYGMSTVVQWPVVLLRCFWDTSTFFSVQAVASCSQNAVGEKEPQVWGQAHFAWSYYYISWKNTCYLKKTTSKLKNRQTNKNNKIEKSKSNAGLFITVDRMVWEKIKYHISIPDDIKPQKDILIIIIVPQITNWLRNLNSFQKWMRQGRRVSKSKK